MNEALNSWTACVSICSCGAVMGHQHAVSVIVATCVPARLPPRAVPFGSLLLYYAQILEMAATPACYLVMLAIPWLVMRSSSPLILKRD